MPVAKSALNEKKKVNEEGSKVKRMEVVRGKTKVKMGKEVIPEVA